MFRFKNLARTASAAILAAGMTIALAGSDTAQASFIFRDYVVTSPDNLASLAIGDTFTVDVAIENLPAATDYDVILNMFVNFGGTILGNATNIVEHFPGTPTFLTSDADSVNMILTVDPVSLSGLTPVLSFDLEVLTAGIETITANGADILDYNNNTNTVYTSSGSLTVSVVPEPAALGLFGLGLVGLGLAARRRNRA